MNTTSLSTPVFELSIEPVGAPAYRDGFHLGTDESIARRLAEEAFKYRTPKVGTGIRSVALFFAGKMFDCYDGLWASDLHEISENKPDLVVAIPGSISHGTMREEDLLVTFADVLRNYAAIQPLPNATHLALARDADALVNILHAGHEPDGDEVQCVLEELFDALDSYSPAGHHFGSHEGDGSNYGWWPNDPDFEEVEGWEEREAKASDPVAEDAEVYLDRGFTLFNALSLPILARERIAKALVNQTILFNA